MGWLGGSVEKKPRQLREWESLEYALTRSLKYPDSRIISEQASIAFRGFREWAISKRGVSAKYAADLATKAWIAWNATDGQPGKLFDSDWVLQVTYQRYLGYRTAINHLANWVLESSKDQNDISWAREQLRVMIAANARRPQHKRASDKNILPRGMNSRPYCDPPATPQDVEALLAAVDVAVAQMEIVAPWMRSLMRIGYLCAMSCEELCGISRSDIEAALSSRVKSRRWIPVMSPATGPRSKPRRRVIPIGLAPEDFRRIVNYDVPWSVVADLVAPCADSVRSLRIGAGRIRSLRQRVHIHAGREIDRKKVIPKIKLMIAGEMLRESKDWIAASQFYGVPVWELKKYQHMRSVQFAGVLGDGTIEVGRGADENGQSSSPSSSSVSVAPSSSNTPASVCDHQ